jgi:hypothetical protein
MSCFFYGRATFLETEFDIIAVDVDAPISTDLHCATQFFAICGSSEFDRFSHQRIVHDYSLG